MSEEHAADQIKPEKDVVACENCGKLIENSKDQNACFGIEPAPGARRLAMCFECGGDPNSNDIRTVVGRVGGTFFDIGIEIVKRLLEPENRAKFEAMDYERQVLFVAKVLKGDTET